MSAAVEQQANTTPDTTPNAEDAKKDQVKQEPIQLTEDGKVSKIIIKEGTGDEYPTEGCKCEVHYVGKLEDGKVFDSSRDRKETFKFTLGMDVIKGWDIAIPTMKKGEIAQVTISHEYGYGEAGSPPSIPPKATLIFEIELIDWEESEDNVLKKVVVEGKGEDTPDELSKVKSKLDQ